MKSIRLNRWLLGFACISALSACTTTDVVPVNNEPTLLQLAELAVIEEVPLDGDLKLTRYASDPQGRFAVTIAPLDGAERNRAFAVAEQNYARMCGHPPFGNSGGAEPGVGKIGSRAPYYDSERRAHFIYVQCSVSRPAG